MESSGITAGEAVLLGNRNNNGDMWGNNGFFWIFALLMLPAMFNGGGGWFGGNRGGQPVTEAGLCDAMNFNNLENAVGRLSDNQAAIARQTDNAICNLGYETLRNFGTVMTQLSECCCAIQRAIDSVNFNISQSESRIIREQEHGTQRILDYLCNQDNQRLRDENMRNYINSQFCGVVRYPMGYTYSAGNSPFFGGCNGYGNI